MEILINYDIYNIYIGIYHCVYICIVIINDKFTQVTHKVITPIYTILYIYLLKFI